MTNEQKQVRDWMSAFGQECPEKPTIPSLEVRKLRAKLILEEALETINALALNIRIRDAAHYTEWNFEHGSDVIEFEDNEDQPNLKEILDGCEDLKVVTEGTLVACGLVDSSTPRVELSSYSEDLGKYNSHIIPGQDPHFNEVMRSNWTKFWTQEEAEKEFGCLTYEAYEDKQGFTLPKPYTEREDKWSCTYSPVSLNRCWLVKDASRKVIKSPSYSPAEFKIE